MKPAIRGETRTMALVKIRFYWPGMVVDIEKYVRNCPRCIRRKAQGKTAAKLVVVDSTYPMDLVYHSKCPLVAMSTYWSSLIILPDMFRLSYPGTNLLKPLPESYLIISSVIMASCPGYTVTRVATLKVKLLRSCVPFQTLINRGLFPITPWAMECLDDLIKHSLICSELFRMAKSLTGRPTCHLWSMHTNQCAMKVLGTRIFF